MFRSPVLLIVCKNSTNDEAFDMNEELFEEVRAMRYNEISYRDIREGLMKNVKRFDTHREFRQFQCSRK